MMHVQAHFGGDYTDGLYVPARLAADFQVAMLPFRWRQIFHEIAVPAVLGLITDGADDFEVRATSSRRHLNDPVAQRGFCTWFRTPRACANTALPAAK